jgi:RTX calcium-binding nonapeptide repeat (4 copies)
VASLSAVSRSLRVALAATFLCLAAAPPVLAHGIMEREGAVLAFRATDFVSRNDINVSVSADAISVIDSTGVGGLDPGDCRPGRVDLDTGYVIEAICPREGVEQVRVNAGEREDDIVADIPIPVRAIGGGGIDQIRTGSLNDIIDAGAGDDRIEPGAGEDTIEGGEGDDVIAAQDSVKDTVVCGEGLDALASFDPIDDLSDDCEAGGPRPRADDTAPVIRAAADVRQRLRRQLTLRVTADEPARFVAQASMATRSRDFPLKPGRGRLASAEGAIIIHPTLSEREVRVARRSLREGRRVQVFVAIVATDNSGNSSIRNMRTITLRR